MTSSYVNYYRNGEIRMELQRFVKRPAALVEVEIINERASGGTMGSIRRLVLGWFSENYPDSYLETRIGSYKFINDVYHIQTFWRTDNPSAAVMMRMRWS
jgi:hypothetical protein